LSIAAASLITVPVMWKRVTKAVINEDRQQGVFFFDAEFQGLGKCLGFILFEVAIYGATEKEILNAMIDHDVSVIELFQWSDASCSYHYNEGFLENSCRRLLCRRTCSFHLNQGHDMTDPALKMGAVGITESSIFV
jgi:hypothetical protein